MSYDKPPKSLRLDEETERRLKVLGAFTGESVSGMIRRYVSEGLDEASKPENIDRLLKERTQTYIDAANRLAALATESETGYRNPEA